MFNILKIYKNLYLSLLLQKLNEGASGGEDLSVPLITESNREKYIKENEKQIISFIDSLAEDNTDEENIFRMSNKMTQGEKNALKNILLGIDFDYNDFEKRGVYSVRLKKLISDFVGESNKIKDDTRKKLSTGEKDLNKKELGKKKSTEGKKGLRTKEEVIGGSKGKLMGLFNLESNRDEVMSDVNIGSLNNVLKKGKLGELVAELKKALKTDDILSFEFSNYGGRNYYKTIKVLENVGYDINGYFGLDEAIGVIGTIAKVEKTQRKIGDLGFKDEIGIIFDYDFDGLIEDDVHFYTKEKDIFEAVETETEFENLLSNLGYENKAEFDKGFELNYFNARLELKNRIGTLLGTYNMLDPGKLLGSKTALKEHVADMEKYKEMVETEMLKNLKFRKLKNKDKAFYEKVKLQAVGAVVGQVHGLGVGIDVKELTKGIIDSVIFGMYNGVFGVGISKNVIKTDDGKFMLNVGTMGFIPYVAAALKVKDGEIKEMEELFSDNIDNDISITLGGAITLLPSVGVAGGGVGIGRLNENTQEGIVKMKQKMGEKLNDVFGFIKDGKKFEETGLKNSKNNREVYLRLKQLYSSVGETEIGANMLKNGALNNYERYLYEQASNNKLNFSGLYVGLAGLYPVIGLNWETHDIKWKQISEVSNTEVEIQEKSEIDLNTYNREAVLKTMQVNEKLSMLLHSDALRSRDTPGMMKLQKSLFEYNKGNKTIDEVWSEYIKVFSEKKMIRYAKKHGNESELEFIKSQFGITNPYERNLILKNVAANLMKKERLEFKQGGKVGLRGLTVNEYNKKYNRTKFFDKLFQKELPDLAERISSARRVYLYNNRDAKEYGYGIVQDQGGVGFSGVEVRKTKETGINRYVGGYHYAVMPKMSFVEIEGKSKDLVNKLPELVLKNLQKQLKEAGVDLKDIESVKEYINNGGDEQYDIDYKILFAKDPECLNDKIILKDLKITRKVTKKEKSIARYMPEYETKKLLLAVVLDEINEKEKKKDEDKDEDKKDSEEGKEDKEEGKEDKEEDKGEDKEDKEEDKGEDKEDKEEDKEDKTEDKGEDKEDKVEDKGEDKEDKVEDKGEDKEDKVEDKGEDKEDKVEDKGEDKQDKVEDKGEDKQDKSVGTNPGVDVGTDTGGGGGGTPTDQGNGRT